MFKTLLIATAIAAAATPALALKVSKSADIAAPPAKVWALIGGFCAISDWHPVIEKCALSKEGDKQRRTLTLKGGGTILEEQLAHNDDKMSYSYKILEGPLPVANYEATIEVAPEGSGSKVTWWSTFEAKGAEPAKVEETIAGIYEAGFKGIADALK
jgi:carbon monoxide dehydrogenase subunit G